MNQKPLITIKEKEHDILSCSGLSEEDVRKHIEQDDFLIYTLEYYLAFLEVYADTHFNRKEEYFTDHKRWSKLGIKNFDQLEKYLEQNNINDWINVFTYHYNDKQIRIVIVWLDR